uniref:Pheromone receptor 2 n=1 Tax=Hypocrea jecorina TaxID=51453 RepID=G9IJ59_HYPJE|nr:pheromone receptor 2 [Trichoderma reesei]
MSSFDPYTQNITILVSPPSSSSPPISIPIPVIDAFNDETASIITNYAAQLGAALAMLLVLLAATPTARLLRADGPSLLHALALLVCVVRTVLLIYFFLTPFSHFYQVWTGDFSQVPAWNYRASIAGTVLSTLLTVVTDAALVNQAWTMVSLFAPRTKRAVCVLSLLITLLAVSFRVAYTVIQCEGIAELAAPRQYAWLIRATLIFNICSIAWFCALFNSKLVAHLVTNRGVLPSRRAMSPMEVLIMANGILMIVPVIFAILEWHHFINFEAGSLTPTSIAIILPLSSLAAQRIANTSSSYSYQQNNNHHHHPSSSSSSSSAAARYKASSRHSSSRHPLNPKTGSLFSTTTCNSTTTTTSSSSAAAAAAAQRTHSVDHASTIPSAAQHPARGGAARGSDVLDPIELGLRQIDGYAQPREILMQQGQGEQFHE